MIIKTKRISSRNNTDTGSKNSEIKLEEKKAPGFREKKTTSSSVTTSSNVGNGKPIISQKTKDNINKGINTIKEGLSDSISTIKGAFKDL